MCDGKLMIV